MALYKRLSLEERKKIKVLSNQGKGVNAIVKELNRAPSTISREICRTVGESGVYYPAMAHVASRHEQKLHRLGRRKIDDELSSLIDQYLMIDHFSPEQISTLSRTSMIFPYLRNRSINTFTDAKIGRKESG